MFYIRLVLSISDNNQLHVFLKYFIATFKIVKGLIHSLRQEHQNTVIDS